MRLAPNIIRSIEMATRTYILTGDLYTLLNVAINEDNKSAMITWKDSTKKTKTTIFGLETDETCIVECSILKTSNIITLVVIHNGTNNLQDISSFSSWFISHQPFQRTYTFSGDKTHIIKGAEITGKNDIGFDIIYDRPPDTKSVRLPIKVDGDERSIDSFTISKKENTIKVVVNCVGEENDPIVQIPLTTFFEKKSTNPTVEKKRRRRTSDYESEKTIEDHGVRY
jgi:hypothetical protein